MRTEHREGRARLSLAHGCAILSDAFHLRRRAQFHVRILMYHRVRATEQYDQLSIDPSRFERQMAYLSEQCSTISLDVISSAVVSDDTSDPSKPLVAVTFDDGYLDNYATALPILRDYDIPATLFVTTEFAAQRTRHRRYANDSGRVHMTWPEIRAWSAEPGLSLGSHTLTHPCLPQLSYDDALQEIRDSRRRIEDAVSGGPVKFFCYPNGDFTQREVQMVASAGYRGAVTVSPGVNTSRQSAYTLNRTEITNKDCPEAFSLKLRGGFDPAHRLLHWRRRRRFRAAAMGVS